MRLVAASVGFAVVCCVAFALPTPAPVVPQTTAATIETLFATREYEVYEADNEQLTSTPDHTIGDLLDRLNVTADPYTRNSTNKLYDDQISSDSGGLAEPVTTLTIRCPDEKQARFDGFTWLSHDEPSYRLYYINRRGTVVRYRSSASHHDKLKNTYGLALAVDNASALNIIGNNCNYTGSYACLMYNPTTTRRETYTFYVTNCTVKPTTRDDGFTHNRNRFDTYDVFLILFVALLSVIICFAAYRVCRM